MQKQLQILIKRVKEHYRKRYNEIVYALMQYNPNVEDIQLLIDNEPNYLATIDSIKAQSDECAKEQALQERLSAPKTVQEYMLEYAQDEQLIISEALTRAQTSEAHSPAEINRKQKRIDKLTKRLDQLEVVETRMKSLIAELAPEKRKVGRPRKDKEFSN